MTQPAKAAALRAGAAAVAIGMVRTYQWTLRPVIGSHCRFWPSCSEYAVEALRMHGAARGTALAARRILRCNPWHEGGIDPVPGVDPTVGRCQTAVGQNGRGPDGLCRKGL
ncbi:membrane protein insertion efficiency factor YidD [Rhodopila sp.]|uniref:membrane protein insertion efficiency factor YidD n=1 Tax=Rhodopila sp. TaxID=2480087 RepID=UPI003D1383EF